MFVLYSCYWPGTVGGRQTQRRESAMKSSQQIWGLVIFVVLCLATGFIGSLATTPNIEGWYDLIEKPDWTPPSSVFGPVWTALYLMMALAAWFVWRKPDAKRTIPLVLFFFQLFLNALWSWIFFGAHNPGAAVVEIFLLWVVFRDLAIRYVRRDRECPLPSIFLLITSGICPISIKRFPPIRV